MDSTLATQHATAVAREVVRLGLADQDSVRAQFQDYTGYLRQGVQATFTQLLLSRGVIDPGGYERLQAACPPGAAPSLMPTASGSMPQLVSPAEDKGAATGEFDNVLSPQRDQPLELSNATPGSRGSMSDTGPNALSGRPLSDSFDNLDLTPEPSAPARIASTTGSATPSQEIVPNSSPDFIMSDDVQDEDGAEPKAGSTLGKYMLVQEIGRGGMGVIYSAKHTKSGDMFAIKVLLGGKDKQSDRRRQRFRREVEAMRRLEHERIVRVYDYGRKGDFDWYSMDFVQGSDFEELLEDGEMEPAEKMRVYYDICEAMAHAHERSVIHRDLKPQNVLVDKAGRGHVLDFGLAKIMDQEIGMTRTGSALGTPFYMAPEQLRSAKHIDTRADVFSLGVILYEIATGVRPFQGNTAAEVGTNILNTQPPRPSVLKKDLHPDIDAICIKALEKDPNRRYKDANELWEDLVRHKKGFGVDGGTGLVGALGDFRRWAGLNKGTVIGIAGVLAAFIGPLVYFVLQSPTGESPTPARVATRPDIEDPPPATAGDPAGPVDSIPVDDAPPPPETSDPATPPPSQEDPKPPVEPTTPDEPSTPDETPKPTPTIPSQPGTPADPPPPEPVEARTPIEKARLALAPPEERGPAGASSAQEGNSDTERLRHLILTLEQGVLPAMAVGDLERAKNTLGSMRRDSKIRTVSDLVSEIDNDRETLLKLRALVATILREQPKRLRGLEIYRGEHPRLKSFEVLDTDHLKLTGEPWQIVDPLALTLRSLRAIVLDERNKDVDNTTAHYGLAILSIYRGDTSREHFDKGGPSTALKRRRRLADWLEESRTQVWRSLHDEAENAWRELDTKERQSASALKRAMDDFVSTYGRTSSYLDRRAEWVTRRLKHSEFTDVVYGKLRKDGTGISWNMKGEDPGDLEIRATDSTLRDPRVFRAEYQSSSLVLENGEVRFPFVDLPTHQGAAELGTRSNDLFECYIGQVRQVIDPDTSWVVFVDQKKVGEDLGDRKFSRLKSVTFESKPDDAKRVFRIKPKEIEVNEAAFGRRRAIKGAAIGAKSKGPLQVGGLELTWERDAHLKAAGLARRLLSRRLLEQESEENVKFAPLALRQIDGSLAGFTFFGEWTVGSRGEFVAGQGAQLFANQIASYARIEFEFACDGGPGVALHLAPSITRGASGVSWQLPSTIKSDPDTYRQVVCQLNANAKQAAVTVDKVRLGRRNKGIPSRGAFVSVEFLGRTTGKIRNLRLYPFTPPSR